MSCEVTTSHCDITWRHDVTLHMTSWYYLIGQHFIWNHSNMKSLITFLPWYLALWPMTLIVKLVQDFIKVNPYTNLLSPYVKQFGSESPDELTDQWKDRTYSITLTSDMGGYHFIILHSYWQLSRILYKQGVIVIILVFFFIPKACKRRRLMKNKDREYLVSSNTIVHLLFPIPINVVVKSISNVIHFLLDVHFIVFILSLIKGICKLY